MAATPYSYRQYTGNGSTTSFAVPFPYLLKAHVHVYLGFNILDGTYTVELAETAGYTWTSGTAIQTVAAPASGQTLSVVRQTPSSQQVVEWQDGSTLIAADLNTSDLQNLYVVQEQQDRNDAGITQSTAAKTAATTATTAATAATTAANTATSTANTALSTANTALTTANTASTNASSAVTTANTASTNASAAVTTANSASTNATAAVTTANTASSNASTALSTANTAASNASTALSTANTAASNASTALATANTASTNATAAVSTANTASTNASAAVTTANTSSTNASTALSTATSANSKADQAISAVSNSINYQLKTNVAAIPATPANDTYIEVQDSTGLESFTPLAGKPAGFVGDSGLSVRLRYTSAGTTWNWLNYYPNNSETRYLKLTGGTLTGNITLAGAPSSNLHPATKAYVDGYVGSINGDIASLSSTKLNSSTAASTYQTQAGMSSYLTTATAGTTYAPKASPTFTGTLDSPVIRSGTGLTATAANPTYSFSGATTTGFYSPTGGGLMMVTGGADRLWVSTTGNVGIGTTSPGASLEVYRGTIAVTDPNSITTGDPGIYGAFWSQGAVLTQAGYQIAFNTGSNNARTERARIDSSGRLGIGTTSPDHPLVVQKDSGATEIVINAQDGTSFANLRYRSAGTTIAQVGASGSNLLFSIGTNERARIDSSGRLLVGTTSGTGKLTLSGNAVGVPVALTDAATVAVDLSLANNYTLTLAGNRTLGAPTNQTAGQSGLIVITQDATGSRTLAYNSVWKFPGGTAPTLTTTASAVDVLAYYVESATRITARLVSDVK